MMVSSTVDLVGRFTDRMVHDLVENSVLRGSWVEEIVASFLPGWTFPGQWSYFDLLHPDGEHTLSVKHATGVKGRFSVVRKKWAWDNRIAGRDGLEGWRDSEDRPPQYWCHVYVFAWLDGPAERERVMNADAWMFGVLSRAAMYSHFDDVPRTVSIQRVRQISQGGIPGTDLKLAVSAALADDLGIEVQCRHRAV